MSKYSIQDVINLRTQGSCDAQKLRQKYLFEDNELNRGIQVLQYEYEKGYEEGINTWLESQKKYNTYPDIELSKVKAFFEFQLTKKLYSPFGSTHYSKDWISKLNSSTLK